MNEQIKSKMGNKEFVTKILKCEDESAVKEFFSKEGIIVTDEEVQALGSQINVLVEELKKLPENELEAISGGKGPMMKIWEKLDYLPTKTREAIKDKKHGWRDKIAPEADVALFLGEVAAISIGSYILLSKAAKGIKNWWNSI